MTGPVSWEQFRTWLEDHDLPTTTILRIEIVPAKNGEIHLQAKVIKTDEHGRPILRQVPDEHDEETPEVLTEVLSRRLVYLPDAAKAEVSDS